MADATKDGTGTTDMSLKPYDFLKGIPSAVVYAVLGTAATTLAVVTGAMPALIGTGAMSMATPEFVGAVLFIAELVKEAFA